MNNHEVAVTLADIARLLELEGEDTYRVRAYRKAAHAVDTLEGDINDYYREGRLEAIPGVGRSIGELIIELLKTGRSRYYETLKKEIPPELFEVMGVPGIGRKAAVKIHKALGVTTIGEFKRAATTHRIKKIKGMGERAERKLLDSIERYQRRSEETRMPLYRARGIAEEALGRMRDCGFGRAEAAGDVRRWSPMVRDITMIGVPGKEREAVDCFTRSPLVAFAEGGPGRVKVMTCYGVEAALDVVDPPNWALRLLFDTGSEKHLEGLVERAAGMGISLSREGFVDAVTLARKYFKTEEELYGALGLEYIPPELREGMGELEAAESNALPHLIELKDIMGDLHVHSSWSDGSGAISDIAMAARSMGYEYVAVCDHSRSLTVAHGLSIDRLREQMAEIDRLNDTLEGFTILKGSEVDIKADGSLDMPDDVLEELDVVVASMHSGMRQEPEAATARAVSALENPYVTILGHPTGRILGGREPMAIDMGEIIEAAKANGKALELNAYPGRLDLGDEEVRKTVEAGVYISIDTDAHSLPEMGFMEYGAHVARRGWAQKFQVLNALPYEGLLRFLSKQL